ncbi:transglycosylase SLT domain-containing protein [Cognatiluteimonas profundi]|uniref:transglycosylase SLT domain-containing protein n=1 Tax=Cognatiluteimonas profundi TaxID=2594501 RepID=UPI00131CDDCD|nr:transglycosylase SLT domain-containing protein [Lysobacter profundi]
MKSLAACCVVPAVLLSLLFAAPDAMALSRRDQANIDTLDQNMAAAEARYRQALVKIGNNDPTGQNESNAALEDMEDAVAGCGKQKGCQVSTLLATYKRLLKLGADSEASSAGNDEIDPNDPDPDHEGDVAFNAAVPQAAQAASLLDSHTHRFDRMVQYNPAVQAGIRRWLTDMRGALLQSYENYEYMRQMMWPSYGRAGLPEALLFGIMAKESNGKVHATSRSGAAGPMQFMYATGKRFGLGPDATGFDTRYDPRAAAEASASYLNERMGELNRSIELSLAAYNGGEGRALRVYQGAGGRGFWDADIYKQFPPETQDYVPMVIAAAWLFLHPKQYGLSFPNVDARPATLRLAKSATIYELAICLGNRGVREGYMRPLRNLNPRYEADSWLPAGATLNATTQIVGLYNRYCLQGPRATLAEQLVRSDPNSAIVRTGPVTQLPTAVAMTTTVATGSPAPVTGASKQRNYSVQRGETLVSVAQKFQCDLRLLAGANDISGPSYYVRPGQRLRLEGCQE